MNKVEQVESQIKAALAEAVTTAGLTTESVNIHLETPKNKAACACLRPARP